jgi:hypothetical protein
MNKNLIHNTEQSKHPEIRNYFENAAKQTM